MKFTLSNGQQNARSVVLLISSCSGIFSKLFHGAK